MIPINIQEFDIDVLERLVVALQRFYQLRMRGEEFTRDEGVDHGLEDDAPFGGVGAVVWCS